MAGIPFLHNIDLNENQLLNAKLHTSGTAPSSPGTGTIWYDSTNDKVKVYDTNAWYTVGNTTEEIQDIVGAMFSGNTETNIAVTYQDGDGTIDLVSDNDQLTQEQVEDYVGGMVTGNTETGITVTYEDGDGTLDFVVPNSDFALTGDVTGSVTQTAKGNVSIATTIVADAVHATMVNDDIISGQTELASGVADADEMLISDAGTIKKVGMDTLKTYFPNDNDDVDVNIANLTARLPQVTSSVTIGDATDVTVTTSGDLVVTGDLTVSGDTITANVETLNVEDKNITLNYHASSDTSSTAGGSGITIQDAVDASTNATILWDASNDEFDFSHAINVTGGITTSGTIELGHATDTTLSRVSAGDVNIQGNIIYRAGGTNVAIADGGTGADTASAGFIALKQDATTTVTGVVELATTTEAQTGTDTTRAVTAAGLQAFHTNTSKSWVLNNTTSGVASGDNITYTITHGMGASRLYKVEIIKGSGNYETVYTDVQRSSDTEIKVIFASAVSAGAYTALVTKI